jgi:cytochrome-b5 reductase
VAGLTGLVAGVSLFASFASFSKSSFAKGESALDPNNFKKFKLLEVYPVSHNTNRYRFGLENDQKLGLTVASCLVVKAPIGENGKDVIRPYTPVSDNDDKGFFDLIIKTYPNGVMSKHVATLSPGDTLEFKGPFSKFEYTPNMKKKIGMIAGGTGITPMIQVLNQIFKNPKDNTEVSLIFANMSESDVLQKQELDALALRHKGQFKVHYTIDKANSKYWKGDVGHVDESMLKKYLPSPSSDTSILVCGPPGFMKHISGDKTPDYKQGELTGLLKKLNYNESQVFKY